MKDDSDYIRETTLAYGAIMNMMDRIVDFGKDWDELLDMVSEVFQEEYGDKDPEKVFTTVYQFLFRLYLRLLTNPDKRRFNITSVEEKYVRITNYDYKTFKWVKDNGFISGLSNDFVDIPLDKLNNNQINAFKKRAERRNND